MKKIKDYADKQILHKFFVDAMGYDQASMKDKIFNLTKTVNPDLNEDFDANIDKAIDNIHNIETVIIEGDYSYNFSVK